jgi:hypothetical protein
MSAVLEKKYFDSAEIIVMGSALRLRMFLAAVTPEIPFPIIIIIRSFLLILSTKHFHRTYKNSFL